MDYFSLSNQALCREFIRNPQSLIEALGQWLKHRSGKRCKEWYLSSIAGMCLIDEAVRLAADHSTVIKRFNDDGKAGIAPQLGYFNEDIKKSDLDEDYSFESHVERYLQFYQVFLHLTSGKRVRIPQTGERPNAKRDSQWYDWRHKEDMTDAQIRDRWDREHPDSPVQRDNRSNGLGVVKSAIRREKSRRTPGTD
jgi:hypothetical protein